MANVSVILPLLGFLVMGVKSESAQLFYFSREFPIEKLPLTLDNCEELVKDKPIKCIIHGWGESSEKPYFQQMTQEYLINDDVQIIQVDWRLLAGRPYLQAAENTKLVGGYLGEVLSKVEVTSTANILSQVHIIGHSLGAHAAGHAGRAVLQRSGRLPARITGLDPAGPHFELAAMFGERLSPADAAFVDVTHTDAGYFGLAAAVGHVDFYANGGHRPQPGCEPFDVALQLDAAQRVFCSHTRSYAYFIDSINAGEGGELATQCASYEAYKRGACAGNAQIVFGEHVNATTEMGKFYLDITERTATLLPAARRFDASNIVQNLLKIAL